MPHSNVSDQVVLDEEGGAAVVANKTILCIDKLMLDADVLLEASTSREKLFAQLLKSKHCKFCQMTLQTHFIPHNKVTRLLSEISSLNTFSFQTFLILTSFRGFWPHAGSGRSST